MCARLQPRQVRKYREWPVNGSRDLPNIIAAPQQRSLYLAILLLSHTPRCVAVPRSETMRYQGSPDPTGRSGHTAVMAPCSTEEGRQALRPIRLAKWIRVQVRRRTGSNALRAQLARLGRPLNEKSPVPACLRRQRSVSTRCETSSALRAARSVEAQNVISKRKHYKPQRFQQRAIGAPRSGREDEHVGMHG